MKNRIGCAVRGVWETRNLRRKQKKFKKKETERASDPFICVVPVALAWI